MDEISEVRYPFLNLIDFVSGGYFADIAALHIVVGLLFMCCGAVFALFKSKYDGLLCASILYFLLQPFNNPAYTLFGLSPADTCGVVLSIALLCKVAVTGIRVNALLLWIALFATSALIYSLAVWSLNPEFSEQTSIPARLVTIARVFVMTMSFAWIYTNYSPRQFLSVLIPVTGFLVPAICLVYVLQILILSGGVVPYGTFAGAGFSTTLSFGGVSIERGHLSKFMAPLFVPVLLHAVAYRSLIVVFPYMLIMMVNFSASGLSFLVAQCIIGAHLFWPSVRSKLSTGWGASGFMIAAIAAVTFQSAYGAILLKIYNIAFLGDESQAGGRSVGVLLSYLEQYPFGIGYAGSTFRTAPGLPEINMGLYAFLTQLPLLAPIVVLSFTGLISLLWFLYRDGSSLGRLLLIGATVTPFVFAADILWFVPLWWLPIFLLTSYRAQISKLAVGDLMSSTGRLTSRTVSVPDTTLAD